MPRRSKRPPDILLVMFDQLAPQSLPCYGHPVVRAPALARLAREGVVFDAAYCNLPLCAPARFAMMAGRLPSRIGAYDNAAELPASVPTFAHHLRRAGYRTCLAGKMHFVGPDQLHGFEERVTTDIYPGDFGWTPTWEEPERVHWWFHNMLSVTEAGAYDRSLEIDYDEEVAFRAERWLLDSARDRDDRPRLLTLSFIHPHDPYLAPRAYWERYRDAEIDPPAVGYIPPERRDPASRRLHDLYDRGEYRVSPRHVRAARRAYYAMITFADDLLARVLAAAALAAPERETVVIATADHGDMLGERGLWYKMTFFERSVRVPLILWWPGRLAPRRVPRAVSLVDLLPTLADIAGCGAEATAAAPLDGASLMPLARGTARGAADAVLAEYTAEGTTEPLFMIRRGRHKFVAGRGDPPLLFDVVADPHELRNLAGRREHAARVDAFAREVERTWDADRLRAEVIASQRARTFVQAALLEGRVTPWDYEPREDAARRYNRNYGGELYDTDRRARLPFRPEPAKDGRGRA